MLTDTFLKLTSKYNPDKALANDLWLEIFTKYSDPKRHYHTITHLENMMADLTGIKDQVQDWETTLFALYYHDIVYKATSNTNEEDSAKLARQKLKQIGYPEDKITACCEMIIATKLHNLSTHNDTNLLVDADLAILGQKPDVYQQYAEDVRKEYAVYPDFLYNRGRKKALQHFLEMDSIFKTNYFIAKYEKQARLNIANELADIAS
jgi:predicted metal-dependent HD superfamily phosphohydrolase